VEKTAEKDRVARELREQQKVANVKPDEPATSQSGLTPDPSTRIAPRYPSTFTSTPQKRNASDASLDPQSTQTTPKKLVKAEPVIQNLQNLMIFAVFDALFDDLGMEIKWPRGRKMRLLYAEYRIPCGKCSL
jgi:hypothetical protein